MLFRQLSQYQIALNWFGRALSYYDRLSLKRKQSMVRMNLGVTYYKMARYADADKALTESLNIGIKGKWLHRQCFANIALGNVRRLQRDFDSARRHLHAAYNQAQELTYPREEALALEFLGDVYRDEGQPAEARRFYARAKAIAEKLAPEGDIVMEVHRRVGECHHLEGDLGAALPELDRALQMARAQGDRFEEAVTLRVLAEAAAAGGDGATARLRIDQAIAILREIEARHEAANALLASAQLALDEADGADGEQERDRLDLAWSQATAALELYLHVDVAWWTEQGRLLVDRIARRRAARDRAEAGGRRTYAPGDVIIHTSRAMKDLLQLTDMFASSGEPVLVTGETGTGKELVARRIHTRSGRAKGPLVTVNVAAIPATVFEREFFGHVRGAFSGADRDQPGYAALAHGGTLFLDEIGELPMAMQPKLLRLLQEGTYQAIGDPTERRADVRLVAATNADVAKLVAAGLFRADLWYRLRILELDLPPVRERPEDVRPLLRHFLSLAAGRPVDPAEIFDPESLAAAEAWSWPGNVREIAMIARRAHVEQQSRGSVRLDLVDGTRRLTLAGRAVRALAAAEGASATNASPLGAPSG
ncbi:MAG: sigma 54-interacting transcriptional regulator, partial [Krumholzibacteria bacterium]|nr:sigma 54-interacting transcriptional regulator [Candidatus Krumholzibacteria bacterium]